VREKRKSHKRTVATHDVRQICLKYSTRCAVLKIFQIVRRGRARSVLLSPEVGEEKLRKTRTERTGSAKKRRSAHELDEAPYRSEVGSQTGGKRSYFPREGQGGGKRFSPTNVYGKAFSTAGTLLCGASSKTYITIRQRGEN